MDPRLSLLLPRPRDIATTGAWIKLPDDPLIRLVGAVPLEEVRRVKRALQVLGHRAPEITAVRRDGDPWSISLGAMQRLTLVHHPQSYLLEISDEGCRVEGSDRAGLFYGVCTLVQLFRIFSVRPGEVLLPGLTIQDRPDFPHRGVMLDVSRDRVPTMRTLYDLVDLLASWKINQLQLYFEHTFAYRGHEVVWRDASPFTGEEILELDRFCRDRHMELVPNQNSFGHMHRWLIHEPYRELAECPEGIDHPFSQTKEPYSLCPTDDRSFELLGDLYDQLLPLFSSKQVNVGLDETLDLGQKRSAQRCAEVGAGRLYLDHLLRVHGLVTDRGRTMQFWSDIIVKHPELIAELPREAIALEWGYEADHPFEQRCRLFADAKLRFYVCPGTSSWNTIAGRTENALANLTRAAAYGRAAGAEGMLVTDWGDNGHLQPLPISYPGLMAGAALAWNSEDSVDHDQHDRLGRMLSVHAFTDRAEVTGRLTLDLGNTYLESAAAVVNGSLLFRLLTRPEAVPARLIERVVAAGFGVEALNRALSFLDRVIAPLPRARMDRGDAQLVSEELAWVAEMLRLACRIGLSRVSAGLDRPLSAVPAPTRALLAEQLGPLIDQHRRLWLRRSRPGGLSDSARRLERMQAVLTCADP